MWNLSPTGFCFGASTLEIAQKAGISEASIFKPFSTKEELFLRQWEFLKNVL
ncbi:helix-turn-helix domain-containing protein [Trichormus azollae]|uniref:helix-turn-helix domain-containing protein n=1 Tax=Trichormus azollae TaxID=1164 RepID=UPI00325F1493